ncbi:MAG: DUF4365 domain-containing protein [Lewinellaceae bacterium]|nr:DUF4365 domain-containing protein [Saprospiraceae bacterium]MCB9339810.1 DUF4365 domain-containing protein [Lewinellaceae bacterium]
MIFFVLKTVASQPNLYRTTMTEAQIKEELSLHLFSALAARAGYNVLKPRIDSGDDLLVTRSLFMPSSRSLTPSGNWLAFQLKTTTGKQVRKLDETVIYDLRAKNYNDLLSKNLGENKKYLARNPRMVKMQRAMLAAI